MDDHGTDGLLFSLIDGQGRYAQTVISSPEDEIDGFAVPHAASYKRDDHADIGEEDRMLPENFEASELAHDRPVNMIDQPARERYVPVGPQLPDIPLQKGIVEILREFDAQDAGAADGHV